MVKSLTNKKILDLYNSLNGVSNLKGVKFAYAVAKNMSLLEKHVLSLQKASQPSDGFIEYEGKRVELAKKMAIKDDQGSPVIKNNEYAIVDLDSFDKEWDILKKHYKDAIEEWDKQLEEYQELLSETVDIEVYGISQDIIPEDITAGQLSGIYEVILEGDTI